MLIKPSGLILPISGLIIFWDVGIYDERSEYGGTVIARMFYGKIQMRSLMMRSSILRKAESLYPAFILNYYELARSYHRMGQIKKRLAISVHF
jgi:hypothetical protein